MASTYHRAIQQLYVAYFNRPADVAGLAYWEGVVEAAGGSSAAVSAEFAKSSEYQAAFAGLSEKQAVTQVYNNLFGTTPDEAGLNYWATLLANRAITIDNVVTAIAGGALGAGKTTLDNKVTAALAFTNELDTPAEQAAYAKPGAAAAAKAFIASISNAASLSAALIPGTLKASVAAVLEAANTGQSFSLGLGKDVLRGTDGNDTFTAQIQDNLNTLQTADTIDGGAGIDRLFADMGSSSAFAITVETSGVEIVAVRAQAVASDSNDNNNSAEQVQIDAERMIGVNHWESNNSRADLIIEDVRILDSQLTRDITIAMVETDAGHVDFGVYFDQYSLRAHTNSTNLLRLQLLDTRSAAEGKAPLLESPYNGFAFYYNGVLTTIRSAAIDAALDYDQLLSAISAAVLSAGLANVSVSKGVVFTVNDTLGNPVSGTEIVLTATNGTINATGTGAGWLAAGGVPPSSGLHTNMSSTGSSVKDLVTSTIILDDVGRGSMGGDLVVGGLSSGATSSSKGVARFEVEVRDNSKLQVMSSTANSLREVVIVNGVTSSSSSAYVDVKKDKGDLTIAGAVVAATATPPIVVMSVPTVTATASAVTAVDAALPGTIHEHGSRYGLTDVRLVDASAMGGNLTLNAGITEQALAKYLNLTDSAFDPAADDVKVDYLGGAGNDSITLTIDGSVTASNSTIKAGRADFSFKVDGGAGNDSITVKLINGLVGNVQNWYLNQQLLKNVSIYGGAGDDTINAPGAGDLIIDGGAGNDTIYTDNSGVQTTASSFNSGRAVFVFNVADGNPTTAGAQYFYNDLRSQAAASISAVNANLTVTFKGISKTVVIGESMNASANVAINDLHVNQAINEAINLDPVLSKLLVAEDGPGLALLVRSLIDGVMTTSSLTITFDSVPLTASQLALATVPTLFTTAAASTLVDGYTTNFAHYNATGSVGVAEITGANSSATSDNIITGGAGNDVIVLGTAAGVDAQASSNDIIKFAAGFGNDTIVNFMQAGGAGADKLDFSALGGSSAGTFDSMTVDKSIRVVAESGLNDTAEKIVGLYHSAGDSASAQTKVYVAYNSGNIAKVYAIVDGAGTAAGNITATLVGTIDLANAAWGLMGSGDFV